MEYTCPMHPKCAGRLGGSAPSGGMALEPVMPAPPAAHTEYVCPMHPQIVRDAPGNCPICGMTLEPRAISAEKQDDPELRDMRRRFGPSCLDAACASSLLWSAVCYSGSRQPDSGSGFELILATQSCYGAAGLLCPRVEVVGEPEFEHFTTDRTGRRCCIRL